MKKGIFFLLLLFVFSSCSKEEGVLFKIKGDDVGYFVFENFLKKYNEESQGFRFNFAGGGSQTAINSLLDGTADLIFSLKELNNEDLALLKAKNVYPVIIPLIKVPFIVVSHHTLPLDSLDQKQLQKVFSGQIRYWWQINKRRDTVNDPDFGLIDLCSVDARNGGYYFFKKILNLAAFPPDTRYFFHNVALVDYIAENRSSVGYVALPFYSKSENLKVLSNDPELEGKGYLIFNRPLEDNPAIQKFLTDLKSYLYQNQFLLLQKGIKISETMNF